MRLEINYKKNKTIKKHKQAEGKQYAPKLTNNGSLKKSKRKSKNTWRQTLIKTKNKKKQNQKMTIQTSGT